MTSSAKLSSLVPNHVNACVCHMPVCYENTENTACVCHMPVYYEKTENIIECTNCQRYEPLPMYKMRSKNSIPACELKVHVLCLHMQEEAAIETHVYTVCVQISTETFNNLPKQILLLADTRYPR